MRTLPVLLFAGLMGLSTFALASAEAGSREQRMIDALRDYRQSSLSEPADLAPRPMTMRQHANKHHSAKHHKMKHQKMKYPKVKKFTE